MGQRLRSNSSSNNPWIEKVKQYNAKHPNLTYKECMIKLSNKRKKKHGGNPMAVAGAISGVADSVGGLATSIGNQIDQGRRTTHEISLQNGGIEVDKAYNVGEREKKFQDFYRDLMHKRFWDGDSLPPRLRFPRWKTNNKQYEKEQEIADDKLYAYAEKVYGR